MRVGCLCMAEYSICEGRVFVFGTTGCLLYLGL